jgi:hypothetical protein
MIRFRTKVLKKSKTLASVRYVIAKYEPEVMTQFCIGKAHSKSPDSFVCGKGMGEQNPAF